MEADRRIVDRPLDAELGEDDQQARGNAGQRQQRAGALAPSCWAPSGIAAAVLAAARRRASEKSAAIDTASVPQARPQRRSGRQCEGHQRKVTRVSRPSTWGMLDGSSSSISTWTTRASVDEPPSGSTRCMRFTVGATREILPL